MVGQENGERKGERKERKKKKENFELKKNKRRCYLDGADEELKNKLQE